MFFIVMFFADTVAVLLAYLSPWPIFNVMGGVRLSAVDDAVLGALLMVTFFGGMSWIVWAVAAVIVITRKSPKWLLAAQPLVASHVSAPSWLLGGMLIVFGLVLLPIGQPEQQNRSHVENLLRVGQLDAAAEYATELTRDDFPPVWDPPPRLGYGEEQPPILDVLAAAQEHGAPKWFREIYVNKLAQDPSRMLWDTIHDENELSATEFERVLSVLENDIPAESYKGTEEWYELVSIVEDKRFDIELRERLRDYLGIESAADAQE
jgi:hypothetical protein